MKMVVYEGKRKGGLREGGAAQGGGKWKEEEKGKEDGVRLN